MSNVIQKLNGADISEFQPKVDWTQVKSQKLDFIFLRASHGVGCGHHVCIPSCWCRLD